MDREHSATNGHGEFVINSYKNKKTEKSKKCSKIRILLVIISLLALLLAYYDSLLLLSLPITAMLLFLCSAVEISKTAKQTECEILDKFLGILEDFKNNKSIYINSHKGSFVISKENGWSFKDRRFVKGDIFFSVDELVRLISIKEQESLLI